MPWLTRKLSSIFHKERGAGYGASKASSQFDLKSPLPSNAADETLHHPVWANSYPFQRSQSDLIPQQSAQSWELWEPAQPVNSTPSAAFHNRKRPPLPPNQIRLPSPNGSSFQTSSSPMVHFHPSPAPLLDLLAVVLVIHNTGQDPRHLSPPSSKPRPEPRRPVLFVTRRACRDCPYPTIWLRTPGRPRFLGVSSGNPWPPRQQDILPQIQGRSESHGALPKSLRWLRCQRALSRIPGQPMCQTELPKMLGRRRCQAALAQIPGCFHSPEALLKHPSQLRCRKELSRIPGRPRQQGVLPKTLNGPRRQGELSRIPGQPT